MLILLAYLLLLVLVSILSYRKGFQNIFRTDRKLPWYLAGFSIFMINPETTNLLSKMEIVANEGYSGLWIFYTGVLGAGLLPIVFAPLWSRLKFMTDNQFILFRFSGIGARILHIFRALYVGYLVAALMIAQVFISLSKLLMVFFELSYLQSYLVIGGILVLLITKNSLRLSVRTDFFNGIVLFLAFTLGGIMVIQYYGGFTEVYSRLGSEYPSYTRLLPGKVENSSFGSWPTVLVYFLVQWWSVYVLDGAGPEAQRLMNTKGPYQAFKAAFLPLILFSLIFLVHSFVFDAGILMVNESSSLIPEIGGKADLEASFIALYRVAMPEGLGMLVFIAFLVALVSFLETFINWGASFVTVDLFKTYVSGKKSEAFHSRLSYGMMLIIGITGIGIAWFNTHLLGLQKFIFSMAAGVGPVFILRWFWWRINAWSQFSAMLSSLLLAVGWDFAESQHLGFGQLLESWTRALDLSPYAFKLICLTLLVTIIWLSTTFLTPPDNQKTLSTFVRTVKPGGWWKEKKQTRRPAFSPRKALLLLLYPIISILPFVVIWMFKFGSRPLAIVLAAFWLVLINTTVKMMPSSGP